MCRGGCLSCSNGRLARTNNGYLIIYYPRYIGITAHISKCAVAITNWRIQFKRRVADYLVWQSPGACYDRINRLHWSWVHSKYCIYIFGFIPTGGCLSCSDGRFARTNNGYLSTTGHTRYVGITAHISKCAYLIITSWRSQLKLRVADCLVLQSPGVYDRINQSWWRHWYWCWHWRHWCWLVHSKYCIYIFGVIPTGGCLSCSDGRLARINNSYLITYYLRYIGITAHISKRAVAITPWRSQLKLRVADCLVLQSPGVYDRINLWHWSWCWRHRCWINVNRYCCGAHRVDQSKNMWQGVV